MQHWMKQEDTLNAQESKLTYDPVCGKDDSPQDHLDDVAQADILLIPEETLQGRCRASFPACTEDFLYQLENQTKTLTLYGIQDERVQRVALHTDVLTVATMMVQWELLPIAASTLALSLRQTAENQCAKQANVRVNVIVQKNQTYKEMMYIGSIENFQRAMQSVDESMFEITAGNVELRWEWTKCFSKHW